jgi:hypothetical protein
MKFIDSKTPEARLGRDGNNPDKSPSSGMTRRDIKAGQRNTADEV